MARGAHAENEVRMFDAFTITRHPYQIFAWIASSETNASDQ